jgi:hypothetical protein
MTTKTWVGRFCVAGGRVDEEGPWLTSLIRRRQDEEPDELYALVEPASPESAQYGAQLVDVIAQLYRKDVLSLTGALVRSLRAAHEHLLDWNRKSLPEHRVGAGASCVALSAGDAYLAQIGPSLAYIRSENGAIKRLQATDPDFAQSLGIAEDFEPRLTRVTLRPGDALLIASSTLDRIMPPDHIERVLSRDPESVLPEFYLLCKDTPDFALVLVSCFEEPDERPPDFLTINGAEHGTHSASLDDVPLTEAGGVLVAAGGGAETSGAQASAAAAPPVESWQPPRPPITQQVEQIKEAAAPPRVPDVKLRAGGSTPRYRRTTGSGLSVPQFRIPRLAAFAGLAVVLLGLLAYWQLPGSVEQSREERFAALVAGARQSNARAQATSDAGQKRVLLNDARAKLTDAGKIHEDNAEVQGLEADVTAALNVLNAVFEANDVTVIADLAQVVTGDLSAIQITWGGDSAYVLDVEGGRVLRVPLDGSPPDTILESNKQINLTTAGRPVEIVWSDQTQSLVILDEERNTFAYFPNQGTLPLVVRAVDSLGSMDAIAAAGGNLYVLDRDDGQVWRYLPSQGGFDSERSAVLDQADLGDATELAVGQDVYILDEKLGVRRFVLRQETDFMLAGIDTAVVAPASISVLPGSNRVVFADTGNKRIIVASDDGRFLRQIVSASFTDLRAVAIDEGSGRMYILNGDTVLTAAFPP